MSDLACPTCGAELDLMTLFAHEADQRALSRLAAVSIPLGARVLQYVQLFQPARQRLTARKKIKLLLELLPDLERRAITHKGRDWSAPLNAWADAIDQMLAARDAGALELPMKGHGYLHAILARMADKHEAAAEAEREATRKSARAAHVKGAAVTVLDVVPGLVPLPSPAPTTPAGTSPTVRAMKAAIARQRGASATPTDPAANQGESQ
ncbi:hypothetical protein [Comamonas sp. NLF-1-9]|uniref:hypothetical protein n=1 Tax=Comamonas sp. NLF-1-9 TaxID=2853163 RepID=UPI001C4808D8|nr:hypothetical protein [Comamonas sp. NLF-1-9]QXL84105.1 hypothetical protein KUD94_12825 [Comamonas sp. NLF-1-9]